MELYFGSFKYASSQEQSKVRPCLVCKNAHTACDGSRPCQRCRRLQKTHLCCDAPQKRKTPSSTTYSPHGSPPNAPERNIAPKFDHEMSPSQVLAHKEKEVERLTAELNALKSNQRLLENQLRASSLATPSSFVALTFTHHPVCAVSTASAPICNLLGLSLDTILDMPWTELFLEDLLPTYMAKRETIVQSKPGQNRITFEMPLICKTGSGALLEIKTTHELFFKKGVKVGTILHVTGINYNLKEHWAFSASPTLQRLVNSQPTLPSASTTSSTSTPSPTSSSPSTSKPITVGTHHNSRYFGSQSADESPRNSYSSSPSSISSPPSPTSSRQLVPISLQKESSEAMISLSSSLPPLLPSGLVIPTPDGPTIPSIELQRLLQLPLPTNASTSQASSSLSFSPSQGSQPQSAPSPSSASPSSSSSTQPNARLWSSFPFPPSNSHNNFPPVLPQPNANGRYTDTL